MSSKQSLLDTPFTDYTLIAKDGQEIRVHKSILHMESDMFRAMFSNISMKQENSLQTIYNYDDLLAVVKWMHGFTIEFTQAVYVIADAFMIKVLSNYRLYIPKMDDNYIDHFVSILKGEKETSIVEERNYNVIYDEVVKMISIKYYAIRKLIVPIKTYSIDPLLKYPLELIKRWYQSKYRVNNNTDLIIFADKYASVVGYNVVNEQLIPLINIHDVCPSIVKEYSAYKFPLLSTNNTKHITYIHLISFDRGNELINTVIHSHPYKDIINLVYTYNDGQELYVKDIVSEAEYQDFIDFIVYILSIL